MLWSEVVLECDAALDMLKEKEDVDACMCFDKSFDSDSLKEEEDADVSLCNECEDTSDQLMEEENADNCRWFDDGFDFDTSLDMLKE